MDNTDKLGALWQRTSPKGDYFTGEINGTKVVIFANRFKTTDKHPDWIIYKSQPRDAA